MIGFNRSRGHVYVLQSATPLSTSSCIWIFFQSDQLLRLGSKGFVSGLFIDLLEHALKVVTNQRAILLRLAFHETADKAIDNRLALAFPNFGHFP